jgi:hypothetical protein
VFGLTVPADRFGGAALACCKGARLAAGARGRVGLYIVSAIVATEWPLVLWVLVIALETMIIAGRGSPRLVNLSARRTKLLIVPLVLRAIPWMVYA